MNHTRDFDKFYQDLEEQLSKMTAAQFFGSFGLRVDDLPLREDSTEYYSEESIVAIQHTVIFHDSSLNLRCA